MSRFAHLIQPDQGQPAIAITLVTNSVQPKLVGLEGYALTIAGTRPLSE